MNTRKSILAVLSLVMMAALVLSACQPVETTVEVVRTVEVPVEVVETVEVVTTEEVTVIETQVVEVEREAFTTPHPILGDLRVRRALAHCTNKVDLAKSVYPLISEEEQAALVMHSWIASDNWAYPGDENITIYEYNPEGGMALLEEAGWTMDEASGYRVNEAGDLLSLKFTTTTATFRQTWAAVLEQQLAECGVQIIRLHAPASWWFGDTTGLARRDFELGAYAWVGEFDPGGETLYSCDQIPSPANGWEGQNYPGWCNETASAALKSANNTLLQEDRKGFYATQQALFTEEVPVIPLFNRTETFSVRADMTGFAPTPGEEYYVYNANEWAVPNNDTVVLGLTQEPASLFGLVEDAFVAHIVLELLGANDKHGHTTLNYEAQPDTLVEIPTIENGRVQNNDVEVNAGDMVVDADGNVIELAAGVMVRDATGEVVEFTGDPVTMKQLVVNYEFRDDLAWPDGSPLTAEDIELGWAIGCDRDSGATSFITCDKTVSFTVDGLVATHTMLPGDQYPIYFERYPYIYPANRQVADGRLLKDVPAAEWATLPEIAEQPWGFGPYMITEWVKGERLVLEAHPYFYGEIATPNFVVSIVTAENSEAQLLGGQIDMLGSESLVGITEALDAAEQNGQVVNYAIPGATWEHIDLALFVK